MPDHDENAPTLNKGTSRERPSSRIHILTWLLPVLLLVASIGIGVWAWFVVGGRDDGPFADVVQEVNLSLAVQAALTVFVRGALLGGLLSLVGLFFPRDRRARMSRFAFACGAGVIVLAAVLMLAQLQLSRTASAQTSMQRDRSASQGRSALDP